ncbi:hypothetical protein L1987_21474 [Smallanthus sonchifolius]|uniref:Uncharacterized protein n=1 Tax=Smallanthus sonchifolius TaxID=185202 RepID=A0ACB9IWL4_9ASTR|nr:hypothetical protein L1987_21474 [Smallanthus sonchifolius]
MLRGYYEDDVDHLSDDEFTRMMLLDGCFILYIIEHIFLDNETDALGLKSDQIMYTFRNVNKLIEAGIHFKPSEMRSLAHIKFSKRWFSANVELPPITVDDSTKPMLLNLIAYEKCSHAASVAWVTSYICFLDSLIEDPEDVKVLREAGVIENSLGSDKEVAKLFNEIATDLAPNSFAYSETRFMIRRYYEGWSISLLSQLKHEYVRTPWAFLIILALTAVQDYFTIWSPKSRCDDLCTFLKMNHHL